MTKLKKTMAMVLTVVLMATIFQVNAEKLQTKAAETFAMIRPTNNQLKAAGYIDIEWSQASAAVEDYQLYIDDELVITTTETSYEYYTTEVKAFEVYVKANFANGTSENTETITFGVTKKGLGLATDMGANLDLAAMGIGWYYNWGTGPSQGQQYRGIEFVPMQWGGDSYNNINNKMNNWAAKGYKYALAFNEPDLQGQGVISVDDAVDRWPSFLNHGIRVGSPASFLWPSISTWLKDFMVKIDNNVDFVTIHCYPENNPGGASMAKWFLESVVDSAWDLYHKPIWITEFSTSDTSDDNRNVTAQGTAEFWENVMKGLDERSYVERYAAFGFKAEEKPGVGLWYYNTGDLTLGGEVYKNNGNPENFTPENQIDPGYSIKSERRNTLLEDNVTIKGIVCEDYINAAKATATASSVNNNGSGADKAIDGDIGTRWESEHGIDPQSITIDLGTACNIKQVNIIWEDAGASEYYIETSIDGESYTKVAEAEGMSRQQNRNDTIVLSNMSNARYVRIVGTERNTNYGYSIWDMAIYGTEDTKVDETTTPVTTTQRPTNPSVTTIPVTTEPAATTTPVTTESAVTTAQSVIEPVTTPEQITAKRSIKVAKTKVKRAVKGKHSKSAKISLKKIEGVTGYQIKVSTSKKYKKSKTVTKNYKKSTFKFKISGSKIKNKKKLYIKARAYIIIGKKKDYGSWSKVKKLSMK